MYQDPYQQPNQPPYGQSNNGQPPTYYGGGNQPSSPYDQSPYGTPPSPYGQPGTPYGQVQPAPYGAPPVYTPPPPKKKSNTLWIVLGVIGTLLIISCAGCTIASANLGNSTKQATTDYKNATATASSQKVTATVSTQQSFYQQATQGSVVLDDPLDGTKTSNWDEQKSDKTGAYCKYVGGKYHIKEPSKDYFIHCLGDKTNYNNFTIQLDMTIVSGDRGGLIYRYDDNGDKFYYLSFTQDGTYDLSTFKSNDNGQTIDKGNLNTNFHTGLNQTNQITLIARGSDMYLYINKEYVTHFIDSTYTSGKIGLAADMSSEIAFSNLKVWAA